MVSEAPNLMQFESKVKQITARKRQEEISLIAELLNVYTEGFNLVNSFKPTEENGVQYVWLRLLARSFQTMRSATLLMLCGYYGSALTLLRTVTEDWLVGRDCEHYQPTLCALLHGKCILGGQRIKLIYADIAKRIKVNDKVKDVVYQSDYKFQSKFTHAGRLSLGVTIDQKTNQLRVIPCYDRLLFYTCCEQLMRNGLLMNELMHKFLKSYSNEAAESWSKIVVPKVTAITKWLEKLREKYGNKDAHFEEDD